MGRPNQPARLLPLQHIRKTLKDDTEDADPDGIVGLDKMPINHMQLYSYFKPSLEAGIYSIVTEQNINLTDTEGRSNLTGSDGKPDSLRVWNRWSDPPSSNTPKAQQFEVVAPQFFLDRAIIDSYYPPDGHQDEARVLPHICFNDPHLPWEREAGIQIHGQRDPDPNSPDPKKPVMRSMTPWVGVLVFDPDDLRLETADEGKGLIPGWEDPTKVDINKMQSPNGTFAMTVEQYLKIPPASRIVYENGFPDDTPNSDGTPNVAGKPNSVVTPTSVGWTEISTSPDMMTAIFPRKSLFKEIFKNLDVDPPVNPRDPSKPSSNTPPVPTPVVPTPTVPAATVSPPPTPPPAPPPPAPHNIESFKYLAHVRHINTAGCPDAGIDQDGLFSVVISARTGAIGLQKPTPQIAHLVSIEHIDSTYAGVADTTDRIAMVSLFSWIYLGLPTNPVNFIDTMRNVVSKRQLLRPNDSILASDALTADTNKNDLPNRIKKQLHKRFSLGYTISRWRTETGEEVAAFNRGPLVPQPVSRPSAFPPSSNTSKEYQVLDRGTGLMDLSYSSAWQLGKLLAISDTTFNAALMRFRSLVYNTSADNARKKFADMLSPQETLDNFLKSVPDLAKMSSGVTRNPNRTAGGGNSGLPPPVDHPDMAADFQGALTRELERLSLAGDQIYGDLGLAKPNNNDWVIIHNWVFEKMYFSDIPAHYLIPDPSFLPPEALRFFQIDDTWVDCLLDGALSVANHLDRDDDTIRIGIKAMLNKYLDTPIDGQAFTPPVPSIKPQIPCCGFILRSQIVKVMPDLKISVQWAANDPAGKERHPVCRYTRMDDETVMALFDRPLDQLQSIKFAQPPHQQNFAVGMVLLPSNHLEFQVKCLFTQNAPTGTWPQLMSVPLDVTKNWYNFNEPSSRCINTARMARDINYYLNTRPVPAPATGAYQDAVPNSAELGMQLNNPAYYFDLEPNDSDRKVVVTERGREIAGGKFAAENLSPDTTEDDQGPPPPSSDPKSSGTTNAPGGIPKNEVPPEPIPTQSPARPPRMTVFDRPMTQASDSNVLAALSLQSRFGLTIYPDYKGPPVPFDSGFDPADFSPTGNFYLYDLIFCVRRLPIPRTAKSPPSYRLKEIIIDIPHEGIYNTPRAKAGKFEALLTADYQGPGARMLGNQRFVPFLNRTSSFLSVRLVPRSATSNPTIAISDSRTADVSFKLSEPVIAPVTNVTPIRIRGQRKPAPGCGFVEVDMFERYDTPRGDQLVGPTQCFVVKKPVRDVDANGVPQ